MVTRIVTCITPGIVQRSMSDVTASGMKSSYALLYKRTPQRHALAPDWKMNLRIERMFETCIANHAVMS